MSVSLPLASAIAGFVLTAVPLHGAIQIATAKSGPNSPSTIDDEVAFAEFVSSSDLLHGLAGSGGSWQPNGSGPAGLNDGHPGGDYEANGINALIGKAWAKDGDGISYREFELGLGSGYGFDLTEIQSIASWQGAGFPNQKYQVSVRFVGDGFFTPLLTVDYQPFPELPANNGGSTKVNVTDSTGVIAEGVEAIRFDILDTNSDNGGGAVYAEIDVFGTPSSVDNSPPKISNLLPANNSRGFAGDANLVATFNDLVSPGTGTITLRRSSDDSVVETFDVQSSDRLVFSGVAVSIDPFEDLDSGASYYVQITPNAIEDDAGNPFAGILDKTSWNFTVNSVLFEQDYSTNSLDYAADVSATDLLHGIVPLAAGWNLLNEASPLDLTDGIHGVGLGVVPGDRVQGGWTGAGATVEYHLGLSSQGTGYDITSIQSIADWINVGFGNQAWTVEVKRPGGEYTTLATVDYQPLDNGGATRVTLTDTSGVLATGIEFIRFTANQVNGGLNGGAFIWRELDVFGVPSGDDETSPVALSFSPADNASGVLPTVPLAVTFDEKIQLGSGNVTLKNLSSQSEVVLPVTSPNLSVSDATLTITPSAYLESNTAYAVRIDPTAITDAAGNAFAGINDDTTWNFGTGELDLTSPTIVTFHPATNAEAVPVDTSLVVTFNETIVKGTGTITIKNLDAATETTLAVNSAAVSVLGKVLTIQPGTRFAGNANHSIQIAAGAVKDAAGNGFEGIADDTTWTFNTAAAPLRIMALGDSISVGYTDNPGWANHPFQFGYRSGLYSRLTQANYPFKFVGASPEPWSGTSGDPTHGGTYTPLLDLRSLGQDGHRGYGGASIAAINSSVASYIASDQPDVILLMIGINGISGNSATELNTLVSTIFTASPDVHLIVAQITPLVSFNQSLYDYNLYIRDILVPNYASNGFKVSTVDLYSLFLTDPNNYSSAIAPGVLSNNINHPDNAHYDLMAQRWFEGIEALGLGTGSLTFNSWIATYPAIAGQTGFDQDPDGDGIGNGLENFFGTAPDAYTKGVVADAAVGNTFVFTHPQNPSPASNISGAYRWTKNLVDFHADGDTDAAGTKVEFTTELNTPTEGTTTVTATISGPTPSKLFVEVVATHAP